MSLFLSSSDWMILLQSIHRLHSLQREEDVHTKALELVSLVAPFRRGVFCRAVQTDNGIEITGIRGHKIPQKDLDILRNILSENGFIRGICLNPSGPVMRGPGLSQFSPQAAELVSTDIIPQDMHQATTFALHHEGRVLGFVVLWRGGDDEGFDQKDVCALAYMKDHIALKLACLLPREESEQDQLERLKILFAHLNLTPRELEVLYHTYLGMEEEEVCQALFISSSTYKKHLGHIYTKLQVGSKVKLVKLVEKALR